MTEVHGTPNVDRFVRLMCELLAEQEGCTVTEYKKDRADGASIEAVR